MVYSGNGSAEPSSSSQHRRTHSRAGGGQSDTSQEEANNEDDIDDRKPPTLQVVAVHHHQHHQLHRYHADDNRSVSSQICESGYQSSGALSDGGTAGLAVFTATSSLRSIGSVSSHGSGGRSQEHNSTMMPHHQVAASVMFNAETRYALTAVNSYAASEAAKSDMATVCSGSVAEDIEISSIDCGMNVNLPNTPNNIVPSPHSERVVTVAVTIEATNLRSRSVEFAPSFTTSFHHKQYSSQQATPLQPMSPLTAAAHQAVAACDLEMNDMGPPLSRALLMQSLHQQSSAVGSTPGSRPGSVKSYGSNGASQNSDVVCHVDTDDCGGSLMESVTDGQSSVHSQEYVGRAEAEPNGELHGELLLLSGIVHSHHAHPQEQNDEEPMSGGTHPFLKNGSCGEYSNGRTSPGGTIYKGKGVRRYQGRYMNLPLKRFQQDAGAPDLSLDTVLEADKLLKEQSKRREPQERNGGYYNGYQEGDWRRRSQSPSKWIGRSNGYNNGHNNHMTSPEHRYRGRGRSPSSARNRKNGYNNHGCEINGYYNDNGYNNGNGNGTNGNHHNGDGTNGNHHNGTHRHSTGGYSSSLDNRSRSRSRSNSPEKARRNRRRRRNRSDDNETTPRRRSRNRNGNSSASKSPNSSRRRSRQSSKSGGRSRS